MEVSGLVRQFPTRMWNSIYILGNILVWSFLRRKWGQLLSVYRHVMLPNSGECNRLPWKVPRLLVLYIPLSCLLMYPWRWNQALSPSSMHTGWIVRFTRITEVVVPYQNSSVRAPQLQHMHEILKFLYTSVYFRKIIHSEDKFSQ